MLENQNFELSPLIGINEEILFSHDSAVNPDWNSVQLFRKTFTSTRCPFRFVFISSDYSHRDWYKQLVDLGVGFRHSQWVTIGNRASERDCLSLISLLDFLYAPKISIALYVSSYVGLKCSRSEFLSCLDYFCSYAPYTKQNFLTQLQRFQS